MKIATRNCLKKSFKYNTKTQQTMFIYFFYLLVLMLLKKQELQMLEKNTNEILKYSLWR
jgi:hypothetical protein